MDNKHTLADFKDDIHRCSKCGLCQAVCPVFKLTGNECSVSRGQFIMLDGVVKGDLKLNKNINKYLDLCLKCDKCREFCPSEINVVDILLSAKSDYFKNSIEGKIYGFLESKLIFGTALSLIKTVSKIFTPKTKKQKKNIEKKAVYFGGCVSFFKPKTSTFISELFDNIEFKEGNLGCCGMPFLTTGNFDRFKDQLKENINNLPDDIDYIITDCSSCHWAWNQYAKYLDDERLKEKLSKIELKNLYDLIIDSDLKFESKKHQTITYHKPCHENSDIEKILKNADNIEYKELKDKDECCGFASFEHPARLKTNYKILQTKRKNIKDTGADWILTTCAGCLISIRLMFLKLKSARLIDFLKNECKIKK